jgi:hypothetical protein
MSKSSSDEGRFKRLRKAARKVGNFVGDAYQTTRKVGHYVGDKAVDAYHVSRKVGHYVGDKAVDAYQTTRKVGHYVGDKAVDAYHVSRKVGNYLGDKAVDAYNAYKYAKHTAKLGTVQLNQFNEDNKLIHACVTGTAAQISDAISSSKKIRENKMLILYDDPNPDITEEQRNAQAQVLLTNYNNEANRLNHLKTCMMEYADKTPELKSPKLNSPKLNSPKLNSPKLNSPRKSPTHKSPRKSPTHKSPRKSPTLKSPTHKSSSK